MRDLRHDHRSLPSAPPRDGIARPTRPEPTSALLALRLRRDQRMRQVAAFLAGLRDAAAALRAIADARRGLSALHDAGFDIPALPMLLDDCAADADRQVAAAIERRTSLPYDPFTPASEVVDEALSGLYRRLLDSRWHGALTSMLRLWQVLESYCQNAEDAEIRDLHHASAHFRSTCVTLHQAADGFGFSLHQVRLLQPLPPPTTPPRYVVSPYAPRLQASAQLAGRCVAELEAVNGLVADVSLWGVDCRLHPDLTSPTHLTCWWR